MIDDYMKNCAIFSSSVLNDDKITTFDTIIQRKPDIRIFHQFYIINLY